MTIEKQNTDHWSILGVGSIGMLWAGRFLDKNIPVELLLKNQARLETIKSKGLTIHQNDTSTTYLPEQLHTCDSPGKPIANLLITTKAQQTLSALHALAHRINSNTTLIVLQNGMGITEKIQKHLPDNPLFLGTTTEGAYRTNSHTVVYAAKGDTWLGPASAQKLAAFPTLQAVNQDCFWDENIHPRLWQKFAINCAINGLTVLFQCKNGELLQNPQAREQMAKICLEIENVLSKKGIQFPEALLETASKITEKTANNYTSMLQDFRAQRDLELDYLNTYLCTEAARLHIETPHNQALVESIKQLAAAQRSESTRLADKPPFT